MLAERIVLFDNETEAMSLAVGPLLWRFLPLLKNIRLSGIPFDERVVLNLRKSEWPDQYLWFYREGWTRIIGLEVSWI